ncbi:hypothetical protein V5799_019582 [Amblyomma americanum]|uniref:TRAF1-6 MATH domain-containing protein n=1 Tax=Amblyomma americanum TaxID=6943 RepID=A0AAQ4EWI1_AMBAM
MAGRGYKRVTSVTLSGFGDFLEWRTVQFAGPRPIRNVCVSCGVLYRCIRFSQCSHAFCKACSDRIMNEDGLCQLDGTHLCLTNAADVPLDESIMDNYTVLCPNAAHGCAFEGRLRNLKEHVLEQCLHSFEPYRKSGEQFFLSHFADHRVPWYSEKEGTTIGSTGTGEGTPYVKPERPLPAGANGVELASHWPSLRQFDRAYALEGDETISVPGSWKSTSGPVLETNGRSLAVFGAPYVDKDKANKRTKSPDRTAMIHHQTASLCPTVVFPSGYSSSRAPVDLGPWRISTPREKGQGDAPVSKIPPTSRDNSGEEVSVTEGSSPTALEAQPAGDAMANQKRRSPDRCTATQRRTASCCPSVVFPSRYSSSWKPSDWGPQRVSTLKENCQGDAPVWKIPSTSRDSRDGELSETEPRLMTTFVVQPTGEGTGNEKTKSSDRSTTTQCVTVSTHPLIALPSQCSSLCTPLDLCPQHIQALTGEGMKAGSVDNVLLPPPIGRATTTTDEVMSTMQKAPQRFTAEKPSAPEAALRRMAEDEVATTAPLPADGDKQGEDIALVAALEAGIVHPPRIEIQATSLGEHSQDVSVNQMPVKAEVSTHILGGSTKRPKRLPQSLRANRLQTFKSMETDEECHQESATADTSGDASGNNAAAGALQSSRVREVGAGAQPAIAASSSPVKVSDGCLGAIRKDESSQESPNKPQGFLSAPLREMNRYSRATYLFTNILLANEILEIDDKALTVGDRSVLFGYTFRTTLQFRKVDGVMFFSLGLFFCSGKYDDFCLWPFDMKIFLEIIHPRKDTRNIRVQLRPSQVMAAFAFRKPAPGLSNTSCVTHEYYLKSVLTAGFAPDNTLRVDVTFQ